MCIRRGKPASSLFFGQASGLSPLSCPANRSGAESLSRIDCISNAGGRDGSKCTSRNVILSEFSEHTWHLCRFLFSPPGDESHHAEVANPPNQFSLHTRG